MQGARRLAVGRAARAAALLLTSSLAVCGVKAPPRPPLPAEPEVADGGSPPAGAAADPGSAATGDPGALAATRRRRAVSPRPTAEPR